MEQQVQNSNISHYLQWGPEAQTDLLNVKYTPIFLLFACYNTLYDAKTTKPTIFSQRKFHIIVIRLG